MGWIETVGLGTIETDCRNLPLETVPLLPTNAEGDILAP
jgi:hypothetical protein